MIKDQIELAALLKLCRAEGVTEISIDGLSVKFGEKPVRRRKKDEAEIEPPSGPTEEELMFYSVTTPGSNGP